MKDGLQIIIFFIIGFVLYELGSYWGIDQNLLIVFILLFVLIVVYFPEIKLKLNKNKLTSLQKDLSKLGLVVNQEEIKKYLNENYGEREVTDKNYRFLLIDLMIENKLGFSIDWKWMPTDILLEIKKIIPKFNFKVEKESEPGEKKMSFKGKILGKDMEFSVPPDKPIEFIEKIKDKIGKLTDKKFKEYESHGDDYVFLLVPKA